MWWRSKFWRNERASAAAIAFLRDISRGTVARASELDRDAVQRARAMAGQVERGFAQCLAGQRAGVHAAPPGSASAR